MSEVASKPEAAGETGRPPRTVVLAFATDADSEAVLRDALGAEVAEGADVRRGGLDEAVRVLRRNPSPQVLLVDISAEKQPLDALGELSQLVEPDVRVLAIGERQDLTLYRGLVHGLGVLEYLFKPLTRETVAQHFGPVISRQNPGARLLRGGKVIAVTGVHGGVGATTVAANLAWYLAERARRHTLLLDGDLYGGAAAMLLSVKARPGLRIALDTPDRVDDLFIDRSAQAVGERLFVLAAEANLTEPLQAARGALPKLLEALRRRYKFLVCDAPFPGSAIGRDMVEAAHQRVLVTEPTLAGARDVLRYLALPQATAGAGAPLVLLNRVGQKGSLGQAQFVKAVGREADVTVADFRGALREAANLGEPAAAKHAGLRRAMQALALRTASVGDAVAKPQGRRWWGGRA